MTANTSNRGYTYPQSTDDFRPYEDIQQLAEDLDTDVRTVAAVAQGFGISLVQTSAQSLGNASATAITYGSSSEKLAFNNGVAWHSTSVNTSRVTPDVAGWYRCEANTSMGTGATSYTQVASAVAKNGTRDDPQAVARPDAGTSACSAFISVLMYCNGTTDYVEHYGTQTAGGANSTSATSGFRSTFAVTLWRADSV